MYKVRALLDWKFSVMFAYSSLVILPILWGGDVARNATFDDEVYEYLVERVFQTKQLFTLR